MFRILGLFLAFTGCSFLGFYKAYEVKRRKDLLQQFYDLILQISTEMNYFKEPLPVIFQRIMTDDDITVNCFLRSCSLAYQMGQQNLSEIWENAINETYLHEPLKNEDLRIFISAGSFLGQSDYQNQSRHFLLLQSQIDQQLAEAQHDIKTKGILYGKAGISLGAVITILLL